MLRMYIFVGSPSRSCGASTVMCDRTLLPATIQVNATDNWSIPTRQTNMQFSRHNLNSKSQSRQMKWTKKILEQLLVKHHKYTVFHKKPDPETSCYNFKKTVLISKKCWYKQSTRTTKVIVNVQNVVLWPWRRLWVVSSIGQWLRPQSSVPSQTRP